MNRLKVMLRYVKHSRAVRDKKFRNRILTFFGICVLVLCFANLYAILAPKRSQEVIVHIKRGDSTREIATKLKANKVIRSEFWFIAISRLTDSDRQLKSGRYVFGGSDNMLQTVRRIREGRSTLIHLTIPEGFSLFQTVKKMESIGIGDFDSLMAIAKSSEVVRKLTGFEVNSLEGFLYPETYVFDIDISNEEIFSLMTRQFFKRVSAAGISIDDEDDFYDTLILASIVEREAVKEEEKPLITGVYLNRLKKDMKLESCPTVDYILEQRGEKRRALTYDDLQINSLYNTYIHAGLPPTPICNPSVSALLAVMNPEVTNYLYFFADFKGNNVFSKTYAEHMNKQKRYNRNSNNN